MTRMYKHDLRHTMVGSVVRRWWIRVRALAVCAASPLR